MSVITTIGIAGEPGAGKTTLLNLLTRELGYKVDAFGRWLREEQLKHESAHLRSLPFKEYYRNIIKDEKELVKIRERNLYVQNLAKQGEIIIDSRLALLNCTDSARDILFPHAMVVYLTAPLEVRARRAIGEQQYKSKNEGQIRTILEERHDDERLLGVKLYNFDCHDKKKYEGEGCMMLDSSTLTIDQEVEAILSRVREKVNKE